MDKVELAILALLKGDISLLREQHLYLKEQYKKQNIQVVELGLRAGVETYGYEDMSENLEYISDRWNCESRIR